jgi:putative ABC transport system permease protein
VTRWRDILRLRLRSLARGGDVDRDLARELRAHIDQQIDVHLASGLSPAEARRLAMRDFGPVATIEEACRDTRRVRLLTNVTQDLRYAWRTLVRQPMLLVAASTSIALGVGVNLAIFALANHLLLSIPSAANPGELVHIRTGNGSHVSFAVWRELDESGALGGVAGYRIDQPVTLRTSTESATLTPLLVTANFFDVVRVPVAEGRGFAAEEARANRQTRLVVVSHGFWRRWLAGAPDAVGRAITLNGESYTVTGVLPAGLRSLPGYGLAPDVYLPLSTAFVPQLEERSDPIVQLVGRLREGQGLAAGRAAVAGVLARIGERSADPQVGRLDVFAPVGGLSQVAELREVGAFFLVLMIVAGLVLAIACANVAGLLIGRSMARRREIALRVALGASRARLIQQLLTEGFLLSLAGTGIGLALAGALATVLPRIRLPLPLPVELHLAFDLRLAVLTLGLVLASTLACSLLPALQATRRTLGPALKQAESTAAHRRLRPRDALVVGQVAVSLMLVATAMVFVRNLARAEAVRPGFDIDRVIVADLTFVEGMQGRAGAPVVADLAGALLRLPGVEAASYADGVPLTIESGSLNGTEMRVDGLPSTVRVDYAGNRVGPGYFAVMGIDLLRGRDFSPADEAGRTPVAIVNDAFVQRYLDGQDPVGRRLVDLGSRDAVPVEIVGVVADSRYRTIGEDRLAAIYLPYVQTGRVERRVHLLVRGTGPARPAVPAVRAALLARDASLAVQVEPMTDALAFAFLPSRFGATLLGALGTVGVLLAMVGLFGVVSFAVSRRTSEIGIRMALGASRGAVLRLVLREGAGLVGTGTALGIGLGWLAVRPLSAFLVAGLRPDDPVSFAGTSALFAVVSLLALAVPVVRALRIQPAVALRDE